MFMLLSSVVLDRDFSQFVLTGMIVTLPSHFLLSRPAGSGEGEISDTHIRPIDSGSIVSNTTLASSSKVNSVTQNLPETVSISKAPTRIVKPIDKNYPTVVGQKQETLYQPILPRH